MGDTAIDTNILVDILVDDPQHATRSIRALEAAAKGGALVIGPATLAELATVFARRGPGAADQLQAFLVETGIRATPFAHDDAIVAGQAFAQHLAKRKSGVWCQDCGKRTTACAACGTPLKLRERIATDFLVLAHARNAGRLLTRDHRLRMRGVQVIRP